MNGLRDYRVLSLFTKHISHFNIFFIVLLSFLFFTIGFVYILNCHTVSRSKIKAQYAPWCTPRSIVP